MLEQLRSHYDSFTCMRGHRAMCRMLLPGDLEGKRVLDLECRSGKGVFRLGDEVGARGFVAGVDHSAEQVSIALAEAPRHHWAKATWADYASFAQGYGEDLAAAGVDDESMDVVFVNSAINVAYDVSLCLKEIRRVLVAGGYLHVMGLFSEEPLDAESRRKASWAGDVFGAALTMGEFKDMALACGFAGCDFSQITETHPPEEGLGAAEPCPRFFEAVARAEKG